MGELVNTFTKLLTEFLEQNEKRHNDQLSLQDANGKHIDDLKGRLEKLEASQQQLKDHNEQLEKELITAKQSEENKTKEIISLKADIDTYKTNLDSLKTDSDAQKIRLEEFCSWHLLIASQVSNLNQNNDEIKAKLKDHHEALNELMKRVRRSHQQTTYIPTRVPVKSATTSSFFDGNIHNSQPRVKTPNYQRTKSYLEFDADEEISELNELNDHAEDLKRGVEALNDLQRSFEKSSLYSDYD